ncbi:MAG: RNA methyltransferase [Gemmatimonadetes bacterium]|nr:RNA methyltransferase [Gemmatimonadota bacterium]
MVTRSREKLLRRIAHRKARHREGLFVVEGIRATEEALEAGLGIEFALCSAALEETARGRSLAARLSAAAVAMERVEDGELARFADSETPQGILLVCEQLRRSLADIPLSPAAMLLVCDGVQDPGNLGTLVRSAVAFGAAGVVALEGTVDAWNPKAVRASAGAAFRVPIVVERWEALYRWLAERGIELLVADAAGEDAASLRRRGAVALVVGNEGAGVRPEIKAASALRIAVPMRGSVESLNVAAAGSILLYELSRRLRDA